MSSRAILLPLVLAGLVAGTLGYLLHPDTKTVTKTVTIKVPVTVSTTTSSTSTTTTSQPPETVTLPGGAEWRGVKLPPLTDEGCEVGQHAVWEIHRDNVAIPVCADPEGKVVSP